MTVASRVAVAKASPSAIPSLSWTWKRFEQLTNDDVYDLLALRSEVFVVEQQCVFLDADGVDRSAWHLLGRAGDGAAPLVGYLRCLDPGIKYREPSIGRVIVASTSRGLGLGRVLMDEGIVRARGQWPAAAFIINAQLRLEPFYRSLGFVGEGAPYCEDGIDHLQMRLDGPHR